jgi:hypothetical protein
MVKGYVCLGKEYESGTQLEPQGGGWGPMEEFMEKVRLEKFPSKPPRQTSNFLSPTFTGAIQWCREQRQYSFVHQVEITGSYHIGDANIINNVGGALDDETYYRDSDPERSEMMKERAEGYAESYWKGQGSYTTNKENAELVAEGGTILKFIGKYGAPTHACKRRDRIRLSKFDRG